LIIYQSGKDEEMSHSYAYTKTTGTQAQKQWQASFNSLEKDFREELANEDYFKDIFLRLSSCSKVETFNLNGGHHGKLIWRVLDERGKPIYLNHDKDCVDGWFVETHEQDNSRDGNKFIKKEEFDMLVKKQMIEDPQDLASALKKIGFIMGQWNN
jgi:hypothetical protein